METFNAPPRLVSAASESKAAPKRKVDPIVLSANISINPESYLFRYNLFDNVNILPNSTSKLQISSQYRENHFQGDYFTLPRINGRSHDPLFSSATTRNEKKRTVSKR